MSYQHLNLDRIVKLDFPENHYFQEETEKRQICLHHTASGKGVDGDFHHWVTDPARVATAMIIGYDGTPYKLFNSKNWGHHLGIKADTFKILEIPSSNLRLNKMCIGIEIDAWGPLALHDGHYKSYTGSIVNINEVQLYREPFKTYPDSPDFPFFKEIGVAGKPVFHYHKYSPEQIKTVGELLSLWCDGYGIPKDYNPDMWNVSKRALGETPGIWTHVSYRADKQDCHPQPELINMLKSL